MIRSILLFSLPILITLLSCKKEIEENTKNSNETSLLKTKSLIEKRWYYLNVISKKKQNGWNTFVMPYDLLQFSNDSIFMMDSNMVIKKKASYAIKDNSILIDSGRISLSITQLTSDTLKIETDKNTLIFTSHQLRYPKAGIR